MPTMILEPEDHKLLDRIGELTGRTPGNITRGRQPLNKSAMLSGQAEAVRQRVLPMLRKAAESGPSTHQQFSESFASMAFTFLEERTPTLREFMVGFQVVDKGEDGNNAFGIFGFQLPTRAVQVPVFFSDGQVKGYQLLFIPDQQLFTPLHEGFVQRLINTDARRNGESGPRYGQTQTIADPGAMSGQMPRTMKYAEALQKASQVPVRPWAAQMGIYASLASWFTNDVANQQLRDVLSTRSYKTAACDLDYYLTRSPAHLIEAIELAKQYPAVYEALGASDSERMTKLASCAVENGAVARQVMTPRSPFKSFLNGEELHRRIVKQANVQATNAQELAQMPDLVFYVAPPTSRWMSEDKAQRITDKVAENGICFDDKRPLSKIAEAEEVPEYTGLVSMDLNSLQPESPCEIKVLCKDRKLQQVVFIPAKYRVSMGRYGSLLLKRDGSEVAQVNGHVVTFDQEPTKDLDASSLGSTVPSSLSRSEVYVVMDKDGYSYGPFRIGDELSEGVYDIHWYTARCQGGVGSSGLSHGSSSRADVIVLGCENSNLEVSHESMSTDEYGTTDKLLVPKDARLITITSVDDNASDSDRPDPRVKTYLQPMVYDDLDARDLSRLTVKMSKTAAGRYSIADHDLNRRASMITLVVGFGLTEKRAESVLAQLNDGKIHRYMIKRSAGNNYMEDPSAVFPYLEGPIGHSENSRVPYAVDTPESVYEQLPNDRGDAMDEYQKGYEDTEEGHPTLPGNSGAMGGGSSGVTQPAQQAMLSGMKGPMDVTVLASIVANSRIDGAISQASSQILRGNSETGQLLLLLYAQSAAFEEIYSEANMQTLEDTLLNAFEANGDLYLRLKQTNVSSNPATEAAMPESHAMEI